MDEQLRQVVLLLENKWTEKEIELDIDLDEIVYQGNEELLFQVWSNLLDNAIKCSRKKGKIFIALYRTKSGCSVQIEDTGIGISKEVQRRIFEKFYQADGQQKKQGNGLGLTLVKTIVDHHNGDIMVKSEEGVGTTFTVRLPKN